MKKKSSEPRAARSAGTIRLPGVDGLRLAAYLRPDAKIKRMITYKLAAPPWVSRLSCRRDSSRFAPSKGGRHCVKSHCNLTKSNN